MSKKISEIPPSAWNKQHYDFVHHGRMSTHNYHSGIVETLDSQDKSRDVGNATLLW